MACCELVEQLALHLGAGQAVGFLLKLAFEKLFQLVEAVEAQCRRKIVIQLGFAFNLHLLHRNGELRVFASEMFRRVVARESHGDGFLIARFRARQLFFKAGNELTRSDHQRCVLRLAAFEFFAVNAASEVDNQLIAIGGLLGLWCVFIALLLVSDVFERFFNRIFAYRHRQTLQLQTFNVRCLDFRKDFQINRDHSILAFFITFFEVDGRLHRGAKRLFAHHFVDRFANNIVHRLGVQLLAMHFLDQIRRNFAGPETGHFHLRRNLLDFSIDAAGNICGRNCHCIGALEAFVGGLFDLHGCYLNLYKISFLRVLRALFWCGRRDSNPHIVRYWYLKPARLPIPPRPQLERSRTSL